MMFDRSSKGDKSLDSRWHEFRENAKRTASSLAEFSDIDVERYDLDDGVGTPTGRHNPRTFRIEKPLRRVVRDSDRERLVDIRDRDGA